jgi:hypothetical protein
LKDGADVLIEDVAAPHSLIAAAEFLDACVATILKPLLFNASDAPTDEGSTMWSECSPQLTCNLSASLSQFVAADLPSQDDIVPRRPSDRCRVTIPTTSAAPSALKVREKDFPVARN